MIVNITHNLGHGLTDYLAQHGCSLVLRGNDWYAEGHADPQSLIDAYNPWPVEKAKKLNEIAQWFIDSVNELTAGVTKEEKASWPQQVNEAHGLRPLVMLPVMAQQRGVPLDVLIERIKQKEAAFAQAYGAIQGEKDRVEDLIKSMPDAGEHHRLVELWALKCMD